MISIDTLRADRLGSYGYLLPTSPKLDAFAKKSFLFWNHYSNSALTLSSHMSIFTGLNPLKHQVVNFIANHDILKAEIETITQALKHNGYYTGWFGRTEYSMLNRDHGFGRDFYEFYDGFDFDQADMSIRVTNWLEEERGVPFFLFLHSWTPHSPYLADFPFSKQFTSKSYKGKMIADRKYYDDKIKQVDWSKFRFPRPTDGLFYSPLWRGYFKIVPEQKYYWSLMRQDDLDDLNFLESSYDNTVAQVDAAIGDILASLEKTKLIENTVVIITSDHGEEFLEHGNYMHLSHYQEVLRVPLIFYLPGALHRKDVREQTQAIDLFPTLLELTKTSSRNEIEGSSLLPLMLGDAKNPQPISFSYTSWGKQRDASLVTPAWKFIRKELKSKKVLELYNLKKDPTEKVNLLKNSSLDKDSASALKVLKTRMEQYLKNERDLE